MTAAERQAAYRAKRKAVGGSAPPEPLSRHIAMNGDIHVPPPLCGFPTYALRPWWFWTEADRAKAKADFAAAATPPATLEDFGARAHAAWLRALARRVSEQSADRVS